VRSSRIGVNGEFRENLYRVAEAGGASCSSLNVKHGHLERDHGEGTTDSCCLASRLPDLQIIFSVRVAEISWQDRVWLLDVCNRGKGHWLGLDRAVEVSCNI